MIFKRFLVISIGLTLIGASVFAQSRSVYEEYGFQIYPPLTKQRAIVIVATEKSPKKIRLIWYRKDKSVLFDKEFNIEQGEKVIISPVRP